MAFVASAARALPPADVFTQLRGMVVPRLSAPPVTLDGALRLQAVVDLSPPWCACCSAAQDPSHPCTHTSPHADEQHIASLLQPPAAAAGGGSSGGGDAAPAATPTPPPLPEMPLLGLYWDSPAQQQASPGDAAQPGDADPPSGVASRGFLLRPGGAPVYSCELDAAVLGGGGGGRSGVGVGGSGGSGYGFRPDGFGTCGGSGGGGSGAAAVTSAVAGEHVRVSGASDGAPSPAAVGIASSVTHFAAATPLGEGGARARARSAHTAAVESLGMRLVTLEERRSALAARLGRGGGAATAIYIDGDEHSERVELDRLGVTINRLRQPAGTDARNPCALTTHKLLALAARTAPGGDARSGLASQGVGGLSHSLLQGGMGGEYGCVCCVTLAGLSGGNMGCGRRL